jgi:hypothetical protein
VICPNCGTEYRDGFDRCSECDVQLVATLPPSPADERAEIELVKIFETANPDMIPALQSLLDEAEIDFSSSSESFQIFSGLRSAMVPVAFYVRVEDEAEALAIVAALDVPQPPPVDEAE